MENKHRVLQLLGDWRKLSEYALPRLTSLKTHEITMDTLTAAKRSWNMSRIRGRNTRIEITVRSTLHRLGYRFRLNTNKLPGHPDVVLPKHKVAIFVHGCFWHRHPGCRFAYMPKTRVAFWQDKFRRNVEQDQKVQKELSQLGCRVLVIWGCETSGRDKLANKIKSEMGQLK